MANSFETIANESGVIFYPIIAVDGLKYLRGIDADALIAEESDPLKRSLIVAELCDDTDEFPEYAYGRN